jgi:putative transposase
MRFSFIDAKRAEFPVARLCEVLEVSQSGYFAWKNRPASERQCKDMVLLAHIRERFRLSQETYGSPRMHADLIEDGIIAGRHRIARLMRDINLKARQKRRFKKTTDSDHGGPVAPNHLDQDFAATGPDQKWAADISYIWTAEGWLYLAIVLDLFSRRIIRWAVSDRLKKDLALCTLRRAVALRRPRAGILHHSDRGSQYCSYDFQRMLDRHGFIPSMSSKGNCYDNTMVETLFKTIKSELVWRTSFQSRRQAEYAIARYIDGFYNPIRRHSFKDVLRGCVAAMRHDQRSGRAREGAALHRAPSQRIGT